MRSKTMAYASIAVIVLSSAVLGQDQDQGTSENDLVGQQLLEDIAMFNADLETIKKPVLEELRRRRQVAQKSGDLHNLKEATEDIAAFEKSDKLPPTLMATKPELTKQYRKSQEELNEQMENDFKTAIQGYTRQDKMSEAKAVEERLEKFKASCRSAPPCGVKDAQHRPARKRRRRR
jgi:hypothetical protein